MSEIQFSVLLDALYAAAGDHAAWQRFLAKFVASLGAQSSVLLAFNDRNVSYNINASVGVSQEANALYNEHYSLVDLWFLAGKDLFRPGLVYNGLKLCSAQQFDKSEFYNDFLKRYCDNLFYLCGAVLEMGPNQTAPPLLLSIHRNRRKGAFQQHELRVLGRMVPHLQRGMELHRRIVDLRLKSDMQSWALDQVSLGIILLRADGKVLVANKPAIELCAAKRGLTLGTGGLHALLPRHEGVLQHMISAAALKTEYDAERALKIPSVEENKALVVTVTRTKTPDLFALASDAVVAVFITDPDNHPIPPAQMLTSLFGLTPAEARLAILLAEGNTLQDSADRLRVTLATVRTQRMQIFQKTGTVRQSHLVSLLLRLNSV
jgi:DNA-binding CsgD family transcriptional regulator/PAS domain-containing protein